MKKLLSIIIVAILTFNTFTYASNVDSTESTVVVQSSLSKKLKTLLEHEIFTVCFNYKKINEVLRELVSKMSDEEIAENKRLYPQVSFDLSNFDTEYSTYNWLSIIVPLAIKEGVEKGDITQETIDQINLILKMMGKSTSEITIRQGMSDAEIEQLTEQLVDVATIITDPQILKMYGIDLNDPDTIESLRKSVMSGDGIF